MLDLLQRIYAATASSDPQAEAQRMVLTDLLAHVLATQALAAAAARGEKVTPANVRNWIDAIAGYPGVTLEQVTRGGGSSITVGDRAEAIAKNLLKVAVWSG
jgi:hypothetical protein